MFLFLHSIDTSGFVIPFNQRGKRPVNFSLSKKLGRGLVDNGGKRAEARSNDRSVKYNPARC